MVAETGLGLGAAVVVVFGAGLAIPGVGLGAALLTGGLTGATFSTSGFGGAVVVVAPATGLLIGGGFLTSPLVSAFFSADLASPFANGFLSSGLEVADNGFALVVVLAEAGFGDKSADFVCVVVGALGTRGFSVVEVVVFLTAVVVLDASGFEGNV